MNREPAAGPAGEGGSELRFPLSSTQQRCWVLDRMLPGNTGLNVPFRWIVEGSVSPDAIEEAFAQVIARHEILRTRFVEEGGAAMQEVMPQAEFALGRIDVSRAPDPWARMEEIAAEDALRPFDMGRAGLMRALHIRLGEGRAALCMTFHQSVFDGYSLGVLAGEIAAVLRARAGGTAPELPQMEMQYGDYCLWQKAVLDSPAIAEEEAWWRERLAGAPYTEVAPDRPRPAARSAAAGRTERALAPDFDARLERAAASLGASPFALGAAVLSACLHRLTGARDLVFGTQVGGRPDTLLEGVIGPFVNNVVLRIDAEPDRTLAAQAGIAQEVTRQSLARRMLPFDRLVRALNPPRDPSRTPLISCNLQLFREFMRAETGPGFEIVSTPSAEAGVIYDLALVMVGRETGWSLTLSHAADLFEPATGEALADLVIETFDALLDAPEREIGSIALPPLLERREAPAAAAAHPELEAALAEHSDVAAAAAVDAPGGPHAFVAPEPGRPILLEALPARLGVHLSGRAGLTQPSRISVLSALPETSAGLVDRAALEQLAEGADAPSGEASEAVLSALSAIWSDVLGVDAPAPGDDFFALGGHSLLAVRMATRVRERLGAEIDLGTIYAAPTLAGLAARIGAGVPPAPVDAGHVLQLRGGEGVPLIGINNAAIVLATASVPGRERPAASLQMMTDGPAPRGDPPPFEEIAAQYADYAEAARPEGAILLFGNCVHGNLAVEVARVLQARGRRIAGVVLKNVWEPAYTERMKDDVALRWRERWAALRNRVRLWRMGVMPLDALLGSYRAVRASGVLHLAAWLGLIDNVRRSELEPEQEAFIAWLTEARNRHRPGPVSFPLLHVVTDISPRGRGFATSIGWEELASDLTTVDLPDVILESGHSIGIEEFAEVLGTFLSEREGRGAA